MVEPGRIIGDADGVALAISQEDCTVFLEMECRDNYAAAVLFEDLADRLRAGQLERRGLSVKATVECADHDTARLVEKMAHNLLAAMRAKGEWFNVSEETAIAAIQEAMRLIEDGAVPNSFTGTPVTLHLQPEMMARLDAYRGSATRPEAIRLILERELPK